MLRAIRHNQAGNRTGNRAIGTAPLRRPGAVAIDDAVNGAIGARGGYRGSGYRGRHVSSRHPLVRGDENARLMHYEDEVKQAFDNIVPTLKQISAIQHESDFPWTTYFE